MASFILVLPLLLLAALFAQPIALAAKIPNPTSRITVVGVVYCDTCLTNTFSAHSYFLPGVDVHIDCTFKASSPKTNERMLISVNRTTNKHGIYKLEVPQIDGVDCVDGLAITTVCQAGLISSSSPACSTLGLKTSTNEVSVKSRQENLCVYSLNALNYRPFKRNATLCGNKKEELQSSFNSSTFPLSYFPPYRFPWPPMPQLPPFPPLPFPPLPPLPPLLPLPSPPPFPPVPNFPPAPPLFHPPPPPAFNIGDPRTWIPNFPPLVPSPPPPPSFNLGDPRTWIPNFPPLLPSPPPRPPSPPTPPPTFNLGDPRTWVPYNPPSPPSIPQNQNP